jgi:HPt (histidine-containing phosphotransfer) domain-containing protein
VYKNTLEIFMRDIDKSVGSLRRFLDEGDMKNFCTEVHGVKGSLTLLGAPELSSKALKLENASRESDIGFCSANLPEFLYELSYFGTELKGAFDELRKHQDAVAVPPELPPILQRLTTAMADMDFDVLFQEIDNLNALELVGAVKEDVEILIEAVQTTNYEHAAVIIERLTQNA